MRERDPAYPEVDARDNDPPIFRALTLERAEQRRVELSAPATGTGAHHWFSPRDDRDVVAPPSETRPLVESPVTLEVPVARHGDDDLDGVVNQADPDWSPPDERDQHAADNAECDQDQDRPDRWTGVTRDPDLLPVVAAAETDELGGALDG